MPKPSQLGLLQAAHLLVEQQISGGAREHQRRFRYAPGQHRHQRRSCGVLGDQGMVDGGAMWCQCIYTKGLKEGNVQWENYISMFQTQFLKLDASFDPGMPWDANKKGNRVTTNSWMATNRADVWCPMALILSVTRISWLVSHACHMHSRNDQKPVDFQRIVQPGNQQVYNKPNSQHSHHSQS